MNRFVNKHTLDTVYADRWCEGKNLDDIHPLYIHKNDNSAILSSINGKCCYVNREEWIIEHKNQCYSINDEMFTKLFVPIENYVKSYWQQNEFGGCSTT